MTDRFNTIVGWVLFSGIVGLGLSSLSGHLFQADKPHRPHEMGYPIEGIVEPGAEGAGPDLGTLLAAADPAAGEKLFAKCVSCHTINQGGANGIGPNLYGTVGEPIGKGKGGFAFSADLAGQGGNWDYTNLDHWLANPKGFAPGTKMTFAGMSKPEDRANIIAYLKANGGGPDFPAPAAPAAPEGETAAADAGAAPDAAAAGAAAAETPAADQAAAPNATH
jgi:cytochrome c